MNGCHGEVYSAEVVEVAKNGTEGTELQKQISESSPDLNDLRELRKLCRISRICLLRPLAIQDQSADQAKSPDESKGSQ